jgi:NhaP-type Na+/H+ or K+/H+ antiporter
MVALAVCVTLLLQATTAGPLARRLGLIEDQPATPPDYKGRQAES